MGTMDYHKYCLDQLCRLSGSRAQTARENLHRQNCVLHTKIVYSSFIKLMSVWKTLLIMHMPNMEPNASTKTFLKNHGCQLWKWKIRKFGATNILQDCVTAETVVIFVKNDTACTNRSGFFKEARPLVNLNRVRDLCFQCSISITSVINWFGRQHTWLWGVDHDWGWSWGIHIRNVLPCTEYSCS